MSQHKSEISSIISKVKPHIIRMVFIFNIYILLTCPVYAGPTLSKSNLTLYVGNTYTLKTSNNMGKVKWSTSNGKIVSVKNGKLTAKKKGKALITAQRGKIKASCSVAVKPVKLNKKSATVVRGNTLKLTLYCGKNKGITWKTSNPSVVKIVSKKKNFVTLKGIKTGTVTVTASFKKRRYTCKITVRAKDDNKKGLYIKSAIQTDKGIKILLSGIKKYKEYKIQVSNSPGFPENDDLDEYYFDGDNVIVRPNRLGTHYARVCVEIDAGRDMWTNDWTNVIKFNVKPLYSYELIQVNPYPDVYTYNTSRNILLYVKTDSPDTSLFRISGGDGSVGHLADIRQFFPDLVGREPYNENQVEDPRNFIKVKGGYLQEVAVNKAGDATFSIIENTYHSHYSTFENYVDTGVSLKVKVKDYEQAFEKWILDIMKESGLYSKTTKQEKMKAVCEYLLDNYKYPTVTTLPGYSDFVHLVLFSEAGVIWQNKQLESLQSPAVLLIIAEKIGYTELYQMSGEYHARVTDGESEFSACNLSITSYLNLKDIKMVDLSKR